MMHNLVASAKKHTYIRDLLEGRMLQRVDDEKKNEACQAGVLNARTRRVGVERRLTVTRLCSSDRNHSGSEARSYGRRRVGALVVISTVLAFLVVGTLDIVTAVIGGLFSRNPVKIVRKSWA
jgi:hypothetical protein